MTPEEEKLISLLTEYGALLQKGLDDIHAMVAGIVPCAPVVRHEPTANEWHRFLNDTLGEFDHDEQEANK